MHLGALKARQRRSRVQRRLNGAVAPIARLQGFKRQRGTTRAQLVAVVEGVATACNTLLEMLHDCTHANAPGRSPWTNGAHNSSWLRMTKACLQVPLSFVKVRLLDPSTNTINVVDHPVLRPDDMAYAFAQLPEDRWASTMLGNDANAPRQFWQHHANCEWARDHPALQAPAVPLDKLLPISFHGDEVRVHGQKFLIINWCSDLSTAPSLDHRLLITVVGMPREPAWQ